MEACVVTKIKPPTVQQLVDVIHEYNIAREHELRQMSVAGLPKDYKNPLMDNLYDAASKAALALKMIAVSAEAITIQPRK